MSWLFTRFVRRFDIKSNQIELDHRNDTIKSPHFLSKKDLSNLLKLSANPTMPEYKTHVLVLLMYELGLRRQDIITLKFSDFLKENNIFEDYYRISWVNKKNKKYRSINVPHPVLAKVKAFRAFR